VLIGSRRWRRRSASARTGAGSLLGLAVKPGAEAVYFVDDDANTLNLLS